MREGGREGGRRREEYHGTVQYSSTCVVYRLRDRVGAVRARTPAPAPDKSRSYLGSSFIRSFVRHLEAGMHACMIADSLGQGVRVQ